MSGSKIITAQEGSVDELLKKSKTNQFKDIDKEDDSEDNSHLF